ncbi:MAG: redox-regulated ATPase YchF, partial [Flavobacteriales bacterium]
MGLKCGIVGLPNVGKSTLFNCLSSAKAQAANFPFCTIEPNLGVTVVPDERLYKLEELVKPEKVQPAVVEIVDIAGLVKGASKGEGLGNQFLGNIRECDAILHVLRCFEDPNVVHVDGSVDPVRDKEIIDTELQLKDHDSISKAIQRVEKMAKTGNDKDATKKFAVMSVVKAHLEKGMNARTAEISKEDKEHISDLHLLTAKPVLYVCNVDEASAKSGNAFTKRVEEAIKGENAQMMIITAAMEAEISALETYEERKAFLDELGLDEPGVSKLIRAAYKLLQLQTYFTAGVKEVRAWTITRGMTAPQAAGVIHTDFEKGFIRAEVMKYDDFIKLGSEAACRDAGK